MMVNVQISAMDKSAASPSGTSARPSQRQFATLLTHMEAHPQMSSGNSKGSWSSSDRLRSWELLAKTLNEDCGKGAVKTPKKWRKTFSDWKNTVKNKVKQMQSQPEESTKVRLNDLEKRLVKLQGWENLAEQSSSSTGLPGTPAAPQEIPAPNNPVKNTEGQQRENLQHNISQVVLPGTSSTPQAVPAPNNPVESTEAEQQRRETLLHTITQFLGTVMKKENITESSFLHDIIKTMIKKEKNESDFRNENSNLVIKKENNESDHENEIPKTVIKEEKHDSHSEDYESDSQDESFESDSQDGNSVLDCQDENNELDHQDENYESDSQDENFELDCQNGDYLPDCQDENSEVDHQHKNYEPDCQNEDYVSACQDVNNESDHQDENYESDNKSSIDSGPPTECNYVPPKDSVTQTDDIPTCQEETSRKRRRLCDSDEDEPSILTRFMESVMTMQKQHMKLLKSRNRHEKKLLKEVKRCRISLRKIGDKF